MFKVSWFIRVNVVTVVTHTHLHTNAHCIVFLEKNCESKTAANGSEPM